MTEGRTGKYMKVLLGFYFLEAGLLLLVAPWSRLWMVRVVLPSPVAFQPLLASPSFRGFVAGLGVLHLALAARELLGRPPTPS